MPHSYGASFSGVGLFGPSRNERPTFKAPNPAPRINRIRMGSQPSMCVTRPVLYRLVNVFSSGVARLQVLGVSPPGDDTAPSSNTASYHSPMSIPAAPRGVPGRQALARRQAVGQRRSDVDEFGVAPIAALSNAPRSLADEPGLELHE